jgi:hypothetical protein
MPAAAVTTKRSQKINIPVLILEFLMNYKSKAADTSPK